jgi:hypothetical protein
MNEATTISGLALRVLLKRMDPNLIFFLPNARTKRMQRDIARGIIGACTYTHTHVCVQYVYIITGGPSLVWARGVLADESMIHDSDEVVQAIKGYDANAL